MTSQHVDPRVAPRVLRGHARDDAVVFPRSIGAALRWETSPGPSLATVEECLTQIVGHSPPVGVCIACPWPAERIGEPGVAQTISRLAKALAADL